MIEKAHLEWERPDILDMIALLESRQDQLIDAVNGMEEAQNHHMKYHEVLIKRKKHD